MSTEQHEVPHLTAEDFFSPPVRTSASISPDGSRIAYLAPWRGRLNVWVESTEGAGTARCVTADDRRSVHTYHWTSDPRWLLYQQDGDGDENWHVYRVDLEDPEAAAVDLTPFPGARVVNFDASASREGKALLELNHRNPAEFDLYELDIATGALTMLAQNPGQVGGWLRTPHGELYAQISTGHGDIALVQWAAEAENRRLVTTFDGAGHPMGILPFQATADGRGVWAGSNRNTDRTRLVRLDLATGEEAEYDDHPTLSLDTRATVFPGLPSPLLLDRGTGEPIGARYLGERQTIHALDPHFADVLANLEKLSEGDVSALSSDTSGRRWVVSFTHDRDPGVTYFYDHATGESRMLFRPYPHLSPDALAPMTPVTVTARDGLPLPCYLTLPVGAEPAGLPLVLLVHGGPWFRDSWGYHPVVQMLANRGYAVLQVNFRGSTGFGKSFVQAGIGELAGKMHDDLVDAVEWAVREGCADRERVAIFGGSYGGYAALVGASFTPGVFAAAIDLCGISNLVTFLRSVPEFVKPHLFHNWYLYAGNPEDPEQEADLWARSPLSRADDIRTPLMVVQGGNDTRVVQAESDQIVDAARARGVPVAYAVKDDEGHHFVNPENNIDVYREAVRFLDRHLGGAGHADGDRPRTTTS